MKHLEALMNTLLCIMFGFWTVAGTTWLYKNFQPALWVLVGIAVTVLYMRMLKKVKEESK